MAEFNPGASYDQRREFYRELTKDPDFKALNDKDRIEVTRKVLYSGEPEKPSNFARFVEGMAAGAEGALRAVTPFPGLSRLATGPETIPEEVKAKRDAAGNVTQQGDLGYFINPMPEAIQEGTKLGIEGVRKVLGHDPAKLIEDTMAASPAMGPAMHAGTQGIRNLGRYRGAGNTEGINEGRFSAARDVTPEAPQGLPGPAPQPKPSPATPQAQRPQVFGEAPFAPEVGTPQVPPITIIPEVAPAVRQAAINKAKSRVKKGTTGPSENGSNIATVPTDNLQTQPNPIVENAGGAQLDPIDQKLAEIGIKVPNAAPQQAKIEAPTVQAPTAPIAAPAPQAVQPPVAPQPAAPVAPQQTVEPGSPADIVSKARAELDDVTESLSEAIADGDKKLIASLSDDLRSAIVKAQNTGISVYDARQVLSKAPQKSHIQEFSEKLNVGHHKADQMSELEGMSDDDVLGLVKSGIQKEVTSATLTRAEFAAMQKFGHTPKQPWIKQEDPTGSNVDNRIRTRGKVADQVDKNAQLRADLQRTIDDPNTTEFVRESAIIELGQLPQMEGRPTNSADLERQLREKDQPAETPSPEPDIAMTKQAEPASVPVENQEVDPIDEKLAALGIDTPQTATQNVTEPDPIDQKLAELGIEVKNETGQQGPNPPQLDVREPTVGSAPDVGRELAVGSSGLEDAASPSPGGPTEIQGDVGDGSIRGSDVLSPGATEGTGDRLGGGRGESGPPQESGTDPAAGATSDLPAPVSTGGRAGTQGPKPPPVIKLIADKNYQLPQDQDWLPTGEKQKIGANLAAIQLLKTLEAEGRNPELPEKAILSKYIGWGGLKPVLDDAKAAYREHTPYYPEQKQEAANWEKRYGKEYDALKAALTPEEWRAAASSTENAHYTSRKVIKAVWKAVERLGFNRGSALEPAGGIGHFAGLTPQGIADRVKWRIIEKDSISGRIAAKLYPEAKVEVVPFEDARIPLNSQDLVITNVPFAAAGPSDDRYPPLSLHNYFFVRGLDLVKPGGVMAAITSMSTMDNPGASLKARELIGEKADLIGAIRLPNTAFKQNANTEVTTDILFFRKRTVGSFPDAQAWRDLDEIRTPQGVTKINEYFAKHPDMMLGQMELAGTMHGPEEPTLTPTPGADFEYQLQDAVTKLPENVFGSHNFVTPDIPDVLMNENAKAKPGSLVIAKGARVMRVKEDGSLEAMDWADTPAKAEQARRYINLRDHFFYTEARQFDPNTTDAQVISDMEMLNKLYDNYQLKFGRLNEKTSQFLDADGDDFDFSRSMETPTTVVVEKLRKGKPYATRQTTWDKADIFRQRTLFPRTEPTTADNLTDALQIAINYRATVDLDYIGQMLGKSPSVVTQMLDASGEAFDDPKSGLWEPRGAYLSGYVRGKLNDARIAAADDPRFERHVKELEAVQPADVPIDLITFRIGSRWIPPEAIEAFVKDELDVESKVAYTPETGSYHLTAARWDEARSELNSSTYGVHGFKGTTLVGLALNLKTPIVYDQVPNEHSEGTHQVKNGEKTLEAEAKQDELQDKFENYVKQNPQLSETMAVEYNRTHGGTIPRDWVGPTWNHYPGAATHVNGKEFILRDTQKAGVSRFLEESGLAAHGVGTGKTALQITWAMELRRLGLAKKPMLVVQNATLEQFSDAFKKLYPSAKILVPDRHQRKGAERRTIMSRIASGDYDAVIVPQSWFNMMPDSEKRVRDYIEQRMAELAEAITEAAREEGRRSPKVADLQRAMRALQKRLEKLSDRKTDNALTFEQLGVDALSVDEFHEYKKLEFASQLQPVKGLDKSYSEQGFSMMMKLRFVQEHNQGRNTLGATGTPVSNTIAELWNMIRFFRPDILERFSMADFDSFAGTFGDTVVNTELTPGGDWKAVTRFAKFVNGPELISAWKAAADVKSADQAGITDIPLIKGGQGQTITLPQTKDFTEYTSYLRGQLERFANMTGMDRREYSWIPVVVTGLAKKASLDMRLIDPDLPDDPSSKLNIAAKEIYRIWQESADVKGTQAVFSDTIRDNPENTRFNAHEELRKKLIELGIPAREIIVIDDKVKDEKREMVFNQLNEGDLRVAIGSSKRLGTGVNAQKHMIGLHHLDAPWRPMDIEQREGRILRSGNENPEVEIMTYGVEKSFDASIFQLLSTKQQFTNQVIRGEVDGRNFEDSANSQSLTFDQQMAQLSGDPLAIEKIGLESEIQKMNILRKGHQEQIRKSKEKLAVLINRDIPSDQAEIAKAQATASEYAAAFAEGIEPTIENQGQVVSGRKESVAYLDAYFKQLFDVTAKEHTDRGGKGDAETIAFEGMRLNGMPVTMTVHIPWMPDIGNERGQLVTAAHLDKDRAQVRWYFPGTVSGVRKASTGNAFLGAGLTSSLEAIARKPQDAANKLATDEKDVRALTALSMSPFNREAELASSIERLGQVIAGLAGSFVDGEAILFRLPGADFFPGTFKGINPDKTIAVEPTSDEWMAEHGMQKGQTVSVMATDVQKIREKAQQTEQIDPRWLPLEKKEKKQTKSKKNGGPLDINEVIRNMPIGIR